MNIYDYYIDNNMIIILIIIWVISTYIYIEIIKSVKYKIISIKKLKIIEYFYIQYDKYYIYNNHVTNKLLL